MSKVGSSTFDAIMADTSDLSRPKPKSEGVSLWFVGAASRRLQTLRLFLLR